MCHLWKTTLGAILRWSILERQRLKIHLCITLIYWVASRSRKNQLCSKNFCLNSTWSQLTAAVLKSIITIGLSFSFQSIISYLPFQSLIHVWLGSWASCRSLGGFPPEWSWSWEISHRSQRQLRHRGPGCCRSLLMPRIAHWGEEDFDHSLDCPQILLQSSRIKICQNLPIIEKISFRSCKVYTCHITFTTAAAQENYFVKEKHSKKITRPKGLKVLKKEQEWVWAWWQKSRWRIYILTFDM